MTGIDWLQSLVNYEKRLPSKYSDEAFSTDRYRRLLARLGDPHRCGIPTVQILGTDGKGSTLAFLEELLHLAGKSTCAFISPHLIRVEERFRWNSLPADTSELDRCLEAVRPLAEEGLTYFEALNAAFWLWCGERRPDYVLLETGLGGRLDTTTICHSAVKILTLLDRDHVGLLGGTISKIAHEKLAALVQGVPTIVGKQSAFLEEEIRKHLEENYVTAIWTSTAARAEIGERTRSHWLARIGSGRYGARWWSLALLGDHQVENFASALCALDALGLHPPDLEDPIAIRPRWQARCQVLEDCRGFSWVLDGSHTALSGQSLRRLLDQVFPSEPRVLLCASSRERFPWCYLRGLARKDDRLILVDYPHPRLWGALELRESLESEGWSHHPTPTLEILSSEEALAAPWPHRGVVVASGSLYWAGRALEVLSGRGLQGPTD